MPEYVRVKFPSIRPVEIDQAISGETNNVLMVEAGFHRIDLGQPVDYVPPYVEQTIVGTTPGQPLEIEFSDVRISIKK